MPLLCILPLSMAGFDWGSKPDTPVAERLRIDAQPITHLGKNARVFPVSARNSVAASS